MSKIEEQSLRAIAETLEKLGGLPLQRYCKLTGETPNAIYQRRFKGIWKEGVELTRPDGGDWWVDLAAVSAWRLRRGAPALLPALAVAVRAEDQRPAADAAVTCS